jgi:hypothetical protein
MRPVSRSLTWLPAFALLLAGCVTASEPNYSLSSNEAGIFRSTNAGRPIPVSSIRGMDERQLQATFGQPALDRRDGPVRALRYQSDACTLFVYVAGGKAQHTEAYDPQLRPLINIDQCAGSVAAQKRTV